MTNSPENITLHAKNLTIANDEVKLYELIDDTDTRGEEVGIRNIEYITKHDYMIIFLNESISEKSKYQLYIPFEAPLESALLGYYKSSYIDNATNSTK